MYKILGKRRISRDNLGQKAYNLILLQRFGVIPNFIIIDNSIFQKFLIQNDLLKYFRKDACEFSKMARFLRNKIMQASLGSDLTKNIFKNVEKLGAKSFMIRSSSSFEDSRDMSYAGLFDSFYCRNMKNLPNLIKRVWASQFNEKILSYQKIYPIIRPCMSVIIQSFIFPDFSGVVFFQKRKSREFYIEYGEKSFDMITSGKKCPYSCLIRNSHFFISSKESKNHRHWIRDLSILSENIQRVFKSDLDIEFIIRRDKCFLLQARPLTKKIDFTNKYFLFGSRRYSWSAHDIRMDAFYLFLKSIGISIPFFKFVIKEEESLFIHSKIYFNIIDQLQKKATNDNFLRTFLKLFEAFLLEERRQQIKNIFFDSETIISASKKFLIRMDFFNFCLVLFMQRIESILRKKHKNLKKFLPDMSFSTQFLINHLKEKQSIYALNGHLDNLHLPDIHAVVKKANIYKKKQKGFFKNLSRKEKKIVKIFKKLIWVHDAVNHYEEVIIRDYQRKFIKIQGLDFKTDPEYLWENALKVSKKNPSHKEWRNSKKPQINRKSQFPLHGEVASEGNFSGIAKIINSVNDIKKISKDDIMITKSTRPSLIVGMAICKGIIAEAEGLTSHAAIVSRELGKPCIVGVKNCTKLIKQNERIKIFKGLIYLESIQS